MNVKFAELGSPRRIWAVAAVNGDIDRLSTLHDHLAARFALRDRVVYLGNYLGVESRDNTEVIDEILAFRSALLAKPGVEPGDIVHLRGPAEESWLRLLRLQFAPMPIQTLDKLMAAGVETWLKLYGVSMHDTRSMARAGSMAITRWTNQLRTIQRSMLGHEALISSMKRAAHARVSDTHSMLFVPAGLDPARTLDDQGDALWWSASPFRLTGRAQSVYSRIVRGFDSVNGGAQIDGSAVTLDAGCGRGGPLMCGCFTPDGRLTEVIAIGAPGVLDAPRLNRVEEPAFVPALAPALAAAAQERAYATGA